VYFGVWVRFPPLILIVIGSLAQLARASALHAESRGFESLMIHKENLHAMHSSLAQLVRASDCQTAAFISNGKMKTP
jgi:hypothetical protein